MAPFVHVFSFDVAEGKGYLLHWDPHILVVRIRHPSQAEFHLEFLGLRSVPIEDVDVTADLSGVDSVPLAIVIVWVPSGR